MVTANAELSAKPVGRLYGVAAVGVLVFLGASLLWLGVPTTVASWLALEAKPAIEKLQTGKAPSEAELAVGVSGLRQSLGWAPSARRLTDMALLELEQAERLSQSSPVREHLLADAEHHLLSGLKANPGNGFAWFRLALVRELRGAPERQVASALMQSLDVAPNMRKLWLPRASILFKYWRSLSYEELLTVRSQIRTIAYSNQFMRKGLVQSAASTGELPFFSWALLDQPPSPKDLEELKQSSTSAPRR